MIEQGVQVQTWEDVNTQKPTVGAKTWSNLHTSTVSAGSGVFA